VLLVQSVFQDGLNTFVEEAVDGKGLSAGGFETFFGLLFSQPDDAQAGLPAKRDWGWGFVSRMRVMSFSVWGPVWAARGRLRHASPEWLPSPGCGIAACLIWATDMTGLSPAGWQPCRLLLPALCSSDFDSQHSKCFHPRVRKEKLRPL
jgi:hypothetical protein